MRILHVDTGDDMQGGQWQVIYLMRGLRERGIEQSLVARGPLKTLAERDGFDVSGPLRQSGCDLIHAHDAAAHSKAVVWSRGPVVVSRRVAFPVRSGLASRLKYARARHFIAISHHVAGCLADAGIKPERISVVYDGVPIPEFREAPLGGPVFGMAKQATDKLLSEAARRAGIEVRPVKNLQQDLKHAAALVYLSKSEGLGSGALMAMAVGVPVIASRAGGLTEAIEDERTGLLVRNDAGEVAAALKRVVGDGDLAARFGREGYARAVDRFSTARMVEGTVEVYERLLH